MRPENKLWRSLVRVEKVCGDDVHVVIPSFNPHEVVKIDLGIIPERHSHKLLEPNAHFFANVNIGTEKSENLVIEFIEIAEKPRGEYAKYLTGES